MSEDTVKTVKPIIPWLLLGLLIVAWAAASGARESEPRTDRQTITAIYIPLADHYAGIVA